MIFPTTCKRPVLLVGNGLRSASGKEQVLEFMKKTKIPVLTTMNAVDLIQDEAKLGFIGTYGNRVANLLLLHCDVLISVGARLGIRQIGTHSSLLPPSTEVIRADIDPAELGRTVSPKETKYLLDAKVFMTQLLEEEIPTFDAWHNLAYTLKDRLKDEDKTIGNRVMETLSPLLGKDPIVAVDVGQNQCWAAQSLTLSGEKGRIFIAGGYGSMGCALPFAIGASIAQNGTPVFCVTGDGGFQMNIQELAAVAQEKLPVKIIVLNNHTLGKIREIQVAAYGSNFSMTTDKSGYHVPDFEEIGKAYQIRSATLLDYQELSQYRSWFEDDQSFLLNVCIPEETELLSKVQWKTTTIEPALSPLLSEEIEALLQSVCNE